MATLKAMLRHVVATATTSTTTCQTTAGMRAHGDRQQEIKGMHVYIMTLFAALYSVRLRL